MAKFNDILNTSGWDSSPNTRSSVHAWTKYQPVSVTLASAGTAEDLFSVDSGISCVNHCTNPSIETNASGWTASGATLAKSATVADSGTSSLSITPDNAATGEGGYFSIEVPGGRADGAGHNARYICASAKLQDNADSGDDARLELRDTDGNVLATSATITLTSSWQTATLKYLIIDPVPETLRIYIVTVTQHATVFYADSIIITIRNDGNIPSFFDGASLQTSGEVYEWESTANLSRSRRIKGIRVIKAIEIYVTGGDVYVAFDRTATSTTGIKIASGDSYYTQWPLHFSSNISFLNVTTGETPTVTGVVWGTQEGE